MVRNEQAGPSLSRNAALSRSDLVSPAPRELLQSKQFSGALCPPLASALSITYIAGEVTQSLGLCIGWFHLVGLKRSRGIQQLLSSDLWVHQHRAGSTDPCAPWGKQGHKAASPCHLTCPQPRCPAGWQAPLCSNSPEFFPARGTK